MNYRITFRQDGRDGPEWFRSKPTPEQDARRLAKQIEAKTGYPADVEPSDRPDITTRRVVRREFGIESTPDHLSQEGNECTAPSSPPRVSASLLRLLISKHVWPRM